MTCREQARIALSAILGAMLLALPAATWASSIWPGSTVPDLADSGPDSAAELGVKFRSDVSGTITGVRFYKGAGNTGTHVANLWSSGGALLATATFTGETASGWQQVSFAAPVAIGANTVYVASYHTNVGHYSDDPNYFTGKGADSPPLHALASGVSGANGVFAYGATSTLPSLSWNDSNYFVDVVFTTTVATDTTPPTVTAFTVPGTATTLSVSIATFTATDDVGVTGYAVNESASPPAASGAGWSATAPTSYTFANGGAKTLYAWAKDAAGNVSASRSASVTVTIAISPGPEGAGWYAGDMHAHRSCGGAPASMSSIYQLMAPQNLAAISLLADMGNGEVQNPTTDLPLVNGQGDDPVSTSGRIVHWDAEWHWDPIYWQYPHQALGGHLVVLGVSEAHQIWEEYTSPIFDWAHSKGGLAGFAHMQYLDNTIPQTLSCCGPIEYPVEVALGKSDFISEDVVAGDRSFGGMNPEAAVQAYYRLLNTGFRPGFAAGTDHPCDNGSELGTLLTYVQVADGQMNYRNWIDGIAKGRTVVSRNGHNEFLNLLVNGNATPGDEVKLASAGSVPVTVQWTASQSLSGTIEIVSNGVVVASKQATVAAGATVSLSATVNFAKSGWLAARRMNGNGHQVHTSAVFVTVDNAPVRVSAADANFYVQWMDNLLEKTSPGGDWNSYFPTNLAAAQSRYQAARAVYQQIASEAAGLSLSSIAVAPVNPTVQPGATQQFTATGTYTDGSTQDLTTAVTWASSTTAVASVSAAGLATAVSAGSTTISAALGTVSGNSLLTVQGAPLTTTTIWPATTIPGLVDGGPDSAVELGVKFRADVDGSITGLRFYKASSNTGTHVGNLWSSAGVLLASATFSGETGSGWQQVSLSSPVAITANTVYVASYHVSTGHYSADVSYFAGKGMDSPPLHALANGVSGSNGVYAYGGTSAFPAQTWNSANYWVDVVFDPAPTAPLSSIAVTPLDPTVQPGATQQFAATGTYSDGSTRPLTSTVTWASSSATVASISAAGLATAASAGTTTISATLGSVSGSTLLTVQAAALTITVSSLPDGTRAVAYSNTLAATGGTPPYAWSLASGTLPTGLSLDAGVISGTPTATGTFSFTAKVTDAGSETATKALSITIAAPPALGITTSAMPSGMQGVAYSSTLAASGGIQPYTWSIPAGLPPGLSLNQSTGLVSGTPTATGAYSFTTSVTDALPQTTSQALSIAIMPPGNSTLWPIGTVPTVPDSGPDSAVELGVKFRSDVAGYVTGVRFYKGSGNTGAHVGNLWSSTGTRLGTATFAGETASGWQQVNFATPVAIAANTVYVASYHTNVGHYADDLNYFSGKGVDDPPLHALADGVSGVNGSYAYGSTSSFPNQGWKSSNYWVDVVFTPTGATLSSIALTPASPSIAIGATQQFTATGTYSDGTAQDVTSLAAWTSSNASIATVTGTGLATSAAVGSATISATLSGATGSATLTVSPPPPPPNEGPGGPILIISGAANPISRYYTEVLRAEGFNEFTAMDVSSVTSDTLAGYDVAILGDLALTAGQATMLTGWVNGGGNLVAMRPDKQLAGLLGLADTGGTLSNAYLLVNTASGPGKGIVGETVQFHGPADRYTLSGATALATLYSNATAATTSPAVTLRAVGAGQAAAFTYDLARSVVYTRQGNPAWSGQARDGQAGPIRSDDLFFGAASFDPQPDWIDFGKVQIPQADEQQHLLANLILQMNLAKKPLPRFWALPSGLKAAVVMTGDDHATGGTSGRFDGYLAASPTGCSVADWECVRGTSYVYPNTPVANAQQYLSQGFEIALHVSTNCENFTSYDNLDSFYAGQLVDFASAFPGLPAPSTNRTHCIAWSDFDTQPKVELAHGIRLDTSYYYWPASWIQDRPGFMTGSGMPMRFADRTGQVIDVYQAATQMTDESGQSFPFNIDTLLDNATGPQGYHGVFTANMHTDLNNPVAVAGSDAIVASARAHGVPVVSAQQMMEWLDGRNGSSFGSLSWSGGVLGFGVSVASGARNIQAMLPTQVSGLALTGITRAGAPVSFSTQVVKGVSYGVFGAATGSYQATYR